MAFQLATTFEPGLRPRWRTDSSVTSATTGGRASTLTRARFPSDDTRRTVPATALSADPSGARARMVYELTDAGRAALEGWLRETTRPTPELRDEGMLRLFFSDALPEQRVENIHAMRAHAEHKLDQLRALEDAASRGRTGPYLTLQLGIASTRCLIEWCQAAEERLLADDKEEA